VNGFQLILRFGSVAGALLPHAGHGHQQPANDIANQNRQKRAHLDHAVAARQLALVQRLGQVGVFGRAKNRGVQAHQKHAKEQYGHLHVQVVGEEGKPAQQHHRNFQVFDKAHHHPLVELVRHLPRRGREQQERQDKRHANHQPGRFRVQPAHAELVSQQHGNGELEQVIRQRHRKHGPEKRRKAALAEQGELVGVGVGCLGLRLCTGAGGCG
jgi:hypothetical protein